MESSRRSTSAAPTPSTGRHVFTVAIASALAIAARAERSAAVAVSSRALIAAWSVLRRRRRSSSTSAMSLRTTILAAALIGAQTACGGSSGPPASSSTTACKSLKVGTESASLTVTDTPTAGFSLPINAQPVGIVRDRDGVSVWLLATGLDRVIHVDASGMATSYQLPRSGLGIQLSQGSDGTVWVPEQFRDAVVSIAPDGSAQECTLPRKNSEPMATSVGSDGSVWVSEGRGEAVARLDQGHFTEYPIGPPAAKGAEVLAGSDGGAWFSVMGAQELGHITKDGKIDRISLGGSTSYLGLLETPDGAVWVADFDGDRIVRLAKDRSML